MLQDKLQIFLITYNRKEKLINTLNFILSENSPIKDFKITILDNASTDGTSEVIEEYTKQYPNLHHVRHRRNIGGCANVCRAFELAEKEYVWVLCDDDKYDWSNWGEVEKAIQAGNDIVCLADYVFPSQEDKTKPEHQLFQLTFVPAGIYKTSFITDSVLTAMYDNTYTMLQQSSLPIEVINNNGKIYVLSKPVVFNGLHFEDKVKDTSYSRGIKNDFRTDRKRRTTWGLGYANIITLLKDKKLRGKCMAVAIVYKDIYGTIENFKKSLINYYIQNGEIYYFCEIYRVLPPELQKLFKPYSKIMHCDYKRNSIQKIFSVKNKGNHKVLTILGIKFKFKRKKK